MTLNDTAIRTLQALVADGKRRRLDLASRIKRVLAVLLFRPIEYLGCGAYSIANERGTAYTVTRQSCTCPDAEQRGMTCKHQLAIGLLERVEQAECERAERETAELLAHFAPDRPRWLPTNSPVQHSWAPARIPAPVLTRSGCSGPDRHH